MKRFWIILLILLLAVSLILIGMTKFREPEEPEDILAAAREKMSEVGSMRFDMELNMDISVMKQSLDVNLAMQGEMTAEPSVAHGNMQLEMSGKELTEMEIYLEGAETGTKAYIGMNVGGTKLWTEQNSDSGNMAGVGADVQSGTMELLELATILAETEPEQISETELRFSGYIPSDKIRLALQATGMLAQLQDMELFDASVLDDMAEELEDMPITITVDSEELVITGYQMDMTSVIHKVLLASMQHAMSKLGLGSLADDLLEVANVTTQMKLYDFDEVGTIEIPDYVKKTEPAQNVQEETEHADTV